MWTDLSRLFALPAFRAVWLAMLISGGGSFLLALYLSVLIYERSHSAMMSGAVVALHGLAAVIAAPFIPALLERGRLRHVVIGAELGSISTALLIGVIYDMTASGVVLILVVRGALDAISRSARLVALKMIVPTPLLGPGATFFGTGYLIGGFAGACGGILIAGRNSVDAAVAISVVASAVSCQLYRCLPASRTIADESRSPRQSLGKALVFLKRSRACRVALVMMISSVAFFQGFQIIARAPLPISHWQGTAGTAVLAQLLASAAIVIGTVLPGVRRLTLLFDRYIEVWLLLTMVAMVACTIVTTPQLGLCLYFSFVGLFAVCFTKYQRDVMLYSEQAVMPAIATLMTTGSLGLMSMMIVAFGALADIIGITGISLAMAVAVIATATVAYFVPMPKARETAQ